MYRLECQNVAYVCGEYFCAIGKNDIVSSNIETVCDGCNSKRLVFKTNLETTSISEKATEMIMKYIDYFRQTNDRFSIEAMKKYIEQAEKDVFNAKDTPVQCTYYKESGKWYMKEVQYFKGNDFHSVLKSIKDIGFRAKNFSVVAEFCGQKIMFKNTDDPCLMPTKMTTGSTDISTG